MQPPAAELVTVATSPGCVSYRLLVRDPESLTAPPRIVWSNRVYDQPEGHAGARMRARQWALQQGFRIVEGKEATQKRA